MKSRKRLIWAFCSWANSAGSFTVTVGRSAMIFSTGGATAAGSAPAVHGDEQQRVERGEPALDEGVGRDEVAGRQRAARTPNSATTLSGTVPAWNRIGTVVPEPVRLPRADCSATAIVPGRRAAASPASWAPPARARVHGGRPRPRTRRRPRCARRRSGTPRRCGRRRPGGSAGRRRSRRACRRRWRRRTARSACLASAASVLAVADWPEDRHQRDQGQPDHQRAGRGRGTPRVAQRVLRGQHADRPEHAPVADLEQPGQRPAEPRAQQRDADQDRRACPARSAPVRCCRCLVEARGPSRRHRARTRTQPDQRRGGAATTRAGRRRRAAPRPAGSREARRAGR